MKFFALISALALLAASGGCGGSLPPPDPFNLAEAKDAVSRGNHWYDRGCYAEAERYYLAGLENARLSDNVLLMVRAQNSLGTAALARGDYNAAAGYLKEALNISNGQAGRPELDKVLGNLGALAARLGRNDDAEDFWKKAALAAEEKGFSPAPYYCDLARLYLAAGQQNVFSDMVDKALAALNTDDKLARADALNLSGRRAQLQGDPAGAEELYLQALALDRETESTEGLAQDTEALGLLMIEMKRYAEAAGFLDRAFFLRLAAGRDKEADQLLGHLKKLAAEHKEPHSLEPYLAARRNPAPHRLSKNCP